MIPDRLSPLFQPEVRSTTSVLHEEPWQGRAHLPDPGVLVLAMILAVGLGLLYVASFIVGAEPLPLIAVVAMGVLLALGMGVTTITSKPLTRVRVIDVLAAVAGAMLTLLMARQMGMAIIPAASLVAVMFGGMAVPGWGLDPRAAGAGYTGVFVGMLTPAITLGTWWVLAAAVGAGVLWSLVGPSVWDGVGGRMGAVAYVASSGIYLLANITGNESPTPILPSETGMAHAAVIPIAMAAALVTWALVHRARLPYVLASGISSLPVCGVIALTMPGGGSQMQAAWFGGTFVAAAGANRLPTAFWVGLAGIIFGVLMLHFGGPLSGHVGVLGATAAIACLIAGAVEWALLAPATERWAARTFARLRQVRSEGTGA